MKRPWGSAGTSRTVRRGTSIGHRRMSQLASKLGSRGEVVKLYGTTPPRSGSSPDLIMSAAEKLVARVRGLPLDGFVVYDLQDESSRIAAPRPFPFAPTVDSRGYSKLLSELTGT